MNARYIISDWLEKNGWDGLCNPGAGCQCGKDDLSPCGYLDLRECVAARAIEPNAEQKVTYVPF